MKKICDRHHFLGGKQSISTPCGCVFLLQLKNSLCYLPQCYPTDFEMANLLHVLMTLDEEYDPSVYTTTCTMKEQLSSLPLLPKGTREDTYDQEGNLVFDVTMVGDNGNTISDDDQTDSDSKSIISRDNDVIPGIVTYNYKTQTLTYDNDTIPNGVIDSTSTLRSKS